MSEFPFLLLSLASGFAIGSVFFIGLWLTTRRVLQSRHPAMLALGSFLARSLVAVGGFYLIARRGDWRAVIAAVIGFLAARFLAMRFHRNPEKSRGAVDGS
jgi:F1F0 ATPase subunit 2